MNRFLADGYNGEVPGYYAVNTPPNISDASSRLTNARHPLGPVDNTGGVESEPGAVALTDMLHLDDDSDGNVQGGQYYDDDDSDDGGGFQDDGNRSPSGGSSNGRRR